MPITVSWDDTEKTVLRYDFEGNWTWDEFQQAKEESDAMLDSVPHSVDVILNYGNNHWLPPGAISRLRAMAANTRPNFSGRTIIVSESIVHRTLLNILRNTSNWLADRFTVRFVATVEAARQTLKDE